MALKLALGDLLTSEEAAVWLGCSLSRFYNMYEEWGIRPVVSKSHKRRIYFTEEELRKFAKRRASGFKVRQRKPEPRVVKKAKKKTKTKRSAKRRKAKKRSEEELKKE